MEVVNTTHGLEVIPRAYEPVRIEQAISNFSDTGCFTGVVDYPNLGNGQSRQEVNKHQIAVILSVDGA
jgi:hypothetical protein